MSPCLKRLAVIAGSAVVGLAAAAVGAPASIEDLQYEGRVVVTADGNGMVVTRFPTTVDGEEVTYYLDVQNGCSAAFDLAGTESCPPPVKALNVTLNGEVVFQKASFAFERVEIALHLVGTSDNEIMAGADGERGAAARLAIVAVRPATPPISAKK
jgi:hypothetical protein